MQEKWDILIVYFYIDFSIESLAIIDIKIVCALFISYFIKHGKI